MRALLKAAALLVAVAAIVFALTEGIASRPERLQSGARASSEQMELLRHTLHLDAPWYERLFRFYAGLLPIAIGKGACQSAESIGCIEVQQLAIGLQWPNLGQSIFHRRPVVHLLLESLPETAVLAFAAIAYTIVLSLVLALTAVRWPWAGHLLGVLASAVLALPTFLLAVLLAWLLGYVLGDITGLPISGSLFAFDLHTGEQRLHLSHVVLPALALGLRPSFSLALLLRLELQAAMRSHYARTARAKGLGRFAVLIWHALPNVLNPCLSQLLLYLATFFAGSVFVEFVFGWKGLGHLLAAAIENADFPVLAGITLMGAGAFIVISALMRMVEPRLNPTLRKA